MNNNLLPIAREGFSRIGISVVALIIFAIFDLDFLEFLSFLAIIFFIFVYRNPERLTPAYEAKSVVSPVDGVVLNIEELTSQEYSYKVEINSNYLDVSILRAPLNANVESINIKHGARLSRNSILSKDLNEVVDIVFIDNNQNKVKLTHMLKQSIDDVKVHIDSKQNVLQGNRYGLMVNGLTTIYLPQNFRLNIAVGEEVIASQTLMGYFS